MDKKYSLTIEGQSGMSTVEGRFMNGTNYVSETKVDTRQKIEYS